VKPETDLLTMRVFNLTRPINNKNANLYTIWKPVSLKSTNIRLLKLNHVDAEWNIGDVDQKNRFLDQRILTSHKPFAFWIILVIVTAI
jgi:hypothetical protein